MKKLGVLGAGSWGTALAVHLAESGLGRDPDTGLSVVLWARDADFAAEIQRERINEKYLPAVRFPENLTATHDMDELVDSDAVLVVVPSHGFREVARDFLSRVQEGEAPVLVSATKGIETDTLARMSQVTFEEAVAADREVKFAVLAGPSFAAELARGMPTVAVVASEDGELATWLRHELSSPTFRLYSTTDVVGVELGSTTKNVIAIAAGVVAGMKLGHNALAALLTRGLHEITRLGIACGGQPRTLAGLAGMGDLVLTCTGELSRNRQMGVKLAEGLTQQEVADSTPMVAEGVRNSLAVARLAKRKGVEMPITEQMEQVLYHGKDPRKVVQDLMTRELRSEAEL
ncbi:MAG: NAD(P)-dependent glycerol-3-phosphate dehydrogenase [Thermoanaerobaculia bacterium]|nr:NAD(P)-dependent glycerol-3-phosphate dehydrogenase [Thermoanaerobaculia bacterium]